MNPAPIIAAIAEEVCVEALRLIPVDGVKFTINQRPGGIVPGIGAGGCCFVADLVSLDVDPRLDLTNERSRRIVRYTVAHELHHAARWRSVGSGRIFSEHMVFEGLADHFARQIEPEMLMPWTRPMSSYGRFMCRCQLPLVLRPRRYNRGVWFFRGSRWRGIPRWAGYSLGFEIVGRYLQAVGKRASDCHAIPAAEVLDKGLPIR